MQSLRGEQLYHSQSNYRDAVHRRSSADEPTMVASQRYGHALLTTNCHDSSSISRCPDLRIIGAQQQALRQLSFTANTQPHRDTQLHRDVLLVDPRPVSDEAEAAAPPELQHRAARRRQATMRPGQGESLPRFVSGGDGWRLAAPHVIFFIFSSWW